MTPSEQLSDPNLVVTHGLRDPGIDCS